MKRLMVLLALILAGLTVQGCVRMTGNAGYWHSDTEGQVQSKSVGFDTQQFVSGRVQ
ncbi:MAG: hypothetical protein KTQ49_03655 [Candidatus Omnitrophica bacterium]|nr:hypothetical protein [Candidatus Omnitrophota bacterium]